MVDSINLYISAASDLMVERDLLNRSITEIPVPLGWQITLTPVGEIKQINELALTNAHIHLLLLGEDIRAPVGFEWYLSLKSRKMAIPFLKTGIPRTPAAQSFQRDISHQTNWQYYKNLVDLRINALQKIGHSILALESYFELKPHEVEAVSKFISTIEDFEPESIGFAPGEAGENSVIFSQDRFTPRDGVFIKPPPGEDQEVVDNGF